MSNKTDSKVGRREFIGTAAAASAMIIKPELVWGTERNSAVRLGLLGCGGRGTGVTASFLEHTGAVVTGLGDIFETQTAKAKERLDKVGAKFNKPAIDPSGLFSGPKAYEQLFNSKDVDAIYIATPPYFHPDQFEAAIASGKHIYLEKPVGVDVPGCKKVMKLGAKADGKMSLAVGFQIRHASAYVEMVKRIHNGQMGKPVTGLVNYFASALKRPDTPGASPDERRLRNWVWDRVLSGDIIVEQNIHVIDVSNWVLDGHPVSATAAGGRAGRLDDGDAFSHFNAVYTYPNDVHISFASTQFGKSAWGVKMQYSGTHGVAEANYGSPVRIDGENPWDAPGIGEPETVSQEDAVTGRFAGALDDADPNKQKNFIESITSGKFLNETETGAHSALTAILAREAAYTGEEVTWDQLMKSDKVYDPKIDFSKLG
jgi:myo-inositol 2-dehydrogenase/D-chiro-inositol 1-dehydrogenase